ncbi:hypothetical protein Y032_0242g3458 [Ancylostoma ceylanicum]|uniref:Uncharacterized protein n=1 Tax=Ancylostoma ceylanicum TaxID=53326 RepID=A0A016SEF9_9BILA|nr:hypothetical protein Y032_0242g3458 [Ancylostoma ceylanicum]
MCKSHKMMKTLPFGRIQDVHLVEHLDEAVHPMQTPSRKTGLEVRHFMYNAGISVSRRSTTLIAQTRKRDGTLLLNWLLHIL